MSLHNQIIFSLRGANILWISFLSTIPFSPRRHCFFVRTFSKIPCTFVQSATFSIKGTCHRTSWRIWVNYSTINKKTFWCCTLKLEREVCELIGNIFNSRFIFMSQGQCAHHMKLLVAVDEKSKVVKWLKAHLWSYYR